MSKVDNPKTRLLRSRRFRANGERDLRSKGRGGRRNTVWFGDAAKRWYILIALSLLLSVLLFPSILTRPRIYRTGDIADRDIKASREFLVENRGLTEKTRRNAVKEVVSVYDFDPSGTDLISRIRKAFKTGREGLAETLSRKPASDAATRGEDTAPPDLEALKTAFFEILDIPPSDRAFDILLKARFPAEAEKILISLISRVLRQGVVGNKMMLMRQSGKGITLHDIQTGKDLRITDLDRFFDLKAAREFIRAQGPELKQALIPGILVDVCLDLSASLVKPNLTFNKRETELRKDLARKSVKPFYFKVKKGEMLVREGERISPEDLVKLSAQNRLLRQTEVIGRAPAMAILIAFLLATIYVAGLLGGRSSRGRPKDLLFDAVALLGVFVVVMASNFVAGETARGFHFFSSSALLFAVPVASGAMLVSMFQGIGVAASFSLTASVLACLVTGGRMEFFLYFFIGSLVAAHGVRKCCERSVFIKTGLKVGAVNMALALCIEALNGPFYSMESAVALAAALIGGVLVGVIAAGILPLIEMAFGFTTDIKLLELANLDQPLLRELMVQAPGTHHHSVIVSNLVEASARAINANPLLAKVAAYYHDIGKMKKPLYFIENQKARENRHEKLAPSMSSLILISHVKDGVELAREYRLGREIIDIIRQHHGTSLIRYFYEKAKEQAEKKGGKALPVKEEDYRYPGPRPQTKEAGLVMLADVVEAASRTLVDPTAARIQGMVQKMINKVFSDGQLDECELTLKDLHEIAKSFNKTLSGMFHHRIDYPEAAGKPVRARKGENGNSNHLGPERARGKKAGPSEESGESLKRLGLS